MLNSLVDYGFVEAPKVINRAPIAHPSPIRARAERLVASCRTGQGGSLTTMLAIISQY
jgi:hypothetical protein